MSGGSYNYAYSKLDKLFSWASTLESMADDCKKWAVSDDASTFEDRARIMVRALLLEKAAKRLRGAITEVATLADIMHDVEWVASGDYGIDRLMKPLEEINGE